MYIYIYIYIYIQRHSIIDATSRKLLVMNKKTWVTCLLSPYLYLYMCVLLCLVIDNGPVDVNVTLKMPKKNVFAF